jgi:hypothetical protein
MDRSIAGVWRDDDPLLAAPPLPNTGPGHSSGGGRRRSLASCPPPAAAAAAVVGPGRLLWEAAAAARYVEGSIRPLFKGMGEGPFGPCIHAWMPMLRPHTTPQHNSRVPLPPTCHDPTATRGGPRVGRGVAAGAGAAGAGGAVDAVEGLLRHSGRLALGDEAGGEEGVPQAGAALAPRRVQGTSGLDLVVPCRVCMSSSVDRRD